MTLGHPCRALLWHTTGHTTEISFPVGTPLQGYHLRDIHIRLSAAEFIDPHVRAWLLEVVLPRRASVDEAVCIELGGR